jgi:hypothetical protein
MDKGYKGGQSPGERHVRSGPISKTLHAVCPFLFTLQVMALNTDFPDTEGEEAAYLNNNILVTMKWCEF